MKKIRIFSLMALMAAAGLSFDVRAGQEATSDLQISIKQVEPFNYVSLPHKGPYAAMTRTINHLMEVTQLQDIFPTGPLMSVFYGSPEKTRPGNFEWEVGFPVTPQLLAQPPLKLKQWSYSTVAEAYYNGTFEKMAETYGKILAWLKSQGYAPSGPTMETYVSDPTTNESDEYSIRIWIPCEKR